MALGKHYQSLSKNVVKLVKQLNPLLVMEPQVVYYDEGIGTETDWISLLVVLAGVLTEAVQGAYRFILNYSPEDGDELYLFGFQPPYVVLQD